MSLSLNLYQSMALAVAIFYFGAFLKSKISVFRTYCIPSPVIGGIIYAIVNLILYQTGVLQLSVDTTLQSVFMNVFFTSVGFTAGFGMLKKGGKSLIVFLVAVCILIGIQDVAGAALCKVFGLQPLLGLALGSMPLTGGHGTTPPPLPPCWRAWACRTPSLSAWPPPHMVWWPVTSSATPWPAAASRSWA